MIELLHQLLLLLRACCSSPSSIRIKDLAIWAVFCFWHFIHNSLHYHSCSLCCYLCPHNITNLSCVGLIMCFLRCCTIFCLRASCLKPASIGVKPLAIWVVLFVDVTSTTVSTIIVADYLVIEVITIIIANQFWVALILQWLSCCTSCCCCWGHVVLVPVQSGSRHWQSEQYFVFDISSTRVSTITVSVYVVITSTMVSTIIVAVYLVIDVITIIIANQFWVALILQWLSCCTSCCWGHVVPFPLPSRSRHWQSEQYFVLILHPQQSPLS